MPTYDYVCENCGNRFEEWQKITDEPIKICPACGGPVHRVIYPVGLVFKGSGFYKTDNRAAPAAEASAAGAGTNGADHKAEAPTSGDGAQTPKNGSAGASKGSDAAPAGAAAKSE